MDARIDLNAEIEKLCGRTLSTLGAQRAFELVEARPESLVIRLGCSGKARSIPRREIEKPFAHLLQAGRASRRDIQPGDSPANFSYVAAVLARLPGVSYTTHPIVLWYHKEKQASLLPEL